MIRENAGRPFLGALVKRGGLCGWLFLPPPIPPKPDAVSLPAFDGVPHGLRGDAEVTRGG
jgi:hypothetical protein